MTFQKFHQHHGNNVILLENQTVAFRKYSFAHGITFSDQVFCIFVKFYLALYITQLLISHAYTSIL